MRQTMAAMEMAKPPIQHELETLLNRWGYASQMALSLSQQQQTGPGGQSHSVAMIDLALPVPPNPDQARILTDLANRHGWGLRVRRLA